MEILLASLTALSVGVPIYLALLVGMVLALVKWKSHPQVSVLALIGLGLILLTSIGGTMLAVALPIHLTRSGMTHVDIAVRMAGIGVARSFVEAVGSALVVAAIFSGRRTPAP